VTEHELFGVCRGRHAADHGRGGVTTNVLADASGQREDVRRGGIGSAFRSGRSW
jgi:hypothetical protein